VTKGIKMNQKPEWVRPAMANVGHIDQIIRAGGGKLSITAGDPGEPNRKPPGGE